MKAWICDPESVSWCCAIVLLVVMVLLAATTEIEESCHSDEKEAEPIVGGNHRLGPPCDKIYVVGEGDTLHRIAEKCGDPFIVERNPHIHDPDDVFPGIVIKLDPFKN